MEFFEYNGNNWPEFFEKYWNKQPVVIKNINSKYLLKSQDLYNILAATCDAFENNQSTQIKLYVNNKQLIQNLCDSLPAKSLVNFENHANKIKEKHNSDTFTLYFNGIISHYPTIWLKYYRFLQEIFNAMPMPMPYESVDFESFVGRYKSTAGGIHKENCSNFHFIVHGKKTMRIWHPNKFAGHKMRAYEINSERFLLCSDYEDYLDESIPLTGEAGDILYWPAGFWHVGESPQLSASFNLALYMPENSFELTINNLKNYLEKIGATPTDSAISSSINELRDVISSDAFYHEMMQQKFEKLTSYGFQKIPKRTRQPITEHQIFYVCKHAPIQFLALNDDKYFAYGIFGHVFKTEKNGIFAQLINFLNSTEQSSIIELQKRFGIENTGFITKLIADLYEIHWLEFD